MDTRVIPAQQNSTERRAIVSVAIAHWNVRDLLHDCLTSLRARARTAVWPLEIIVVDNASTDGSAGMVRAKFPEVILIENAENLGFSKATNQAIRASTGRYVLMLNSDTVVLTNAIDRMAQYLEMHPEVGVVGCRLVYPDGRLQRSCSHFISVWDQVVEALYLHRLATWFQPFGRHGMRYWDYNETRPVDWVMATALLVRASILDQLGPLDDELFGAAQDIEFCRRVRDAGWQVVFLHDVEIVHHSSKSWLCYEGEGAAQWRARAYYEQFLSMLHYFRKYEGESAAIRYALASKIHEAIRLVTWNIAWKLGLRSDDDCRVRIAAAKAILCASFRAVP